MINYQDIAAATRLGDDESTVGLEPVLEALGVVPADALQAAQQRALRAYLIRRGKELPTTFTNVNLGADGGEEISILAATWLDGFVTGMRIIQIWNGQRRVSGR